MASNPIGAAGSRPEGAAERPAELVDWFDRWLYHPPARWLARALRPTGATPNMVSVSGFLVLWLAAAAYVGLDYPLAVAAGFALQYLAGVIDGADGDLARLTGKVSPTGELVDGVCDYVGQVGLYIALAALLDDSIGGWAWLVASLAGASHAIQMNHAESQRRYYLWWAYGVPWLKQARAADDEVFRYRNWFSIGFGWMARDYMKLANAMTPFAARVDAAIDAAADAPQRLARIAAQARATHARPLAFQHLLMANPRWLLLGLSMLLGSPLWYFLAEITLLNLVLLASVREHNRVAAALVEAAAAP